MEFDAVCIFFQGSGLLVSEDNTAFHGEFSDDWTVNGKVQDVSCLSNATGKTEQPTPQRVFLGPLITDQDFFRLPNVTVKVHEMTTNELILCEPGFTSWLPFYIINIVTVVATSVIR